MDSPQIKVHPEAPDVEAIIRYSPLIMGQENIIEARVRNLGPVPATNVQARLYEYDPVWNGTGFDEENLTLIGSIDIGDLGNFFDFPISNEVDLFFPYTPLDLDNVDIKLVVTADEDWY